ncbi:2-amino-4-hydroxy-6-hydroxymethyldihydropteridine diphosphokinase [Biformimicrobium ophioploci]|uniref:2-amino-4-hydroxy-6-hydroxymethyldihydropteridine pyrophosphokinase n=1 Tax=Biformimicrobium ophioploci TaxID=3036711 RepID=A0ABQ6LWG6_9GAMM|nr:2-amino-4-hydroxy-6-hydroxymethyldihydropteridine diphosphokinase [Microbulbifer sp. NKW57]GMG86425.1 2-amino-4-hydroxy-6-hydroxymethyldihydropteridine diphosphokinase [Microbulbifer sp. NKW57]
MRAFIGLGSNLEQPRQQLLSACEAMDRIPHTHLLRRSPLYRSAPVGPEGQPDYVNAVAELETALEPEALLDALQAIEQAHGRVRTLRWGARTLDLDILLYGDGIIDSERLQVPHPRIPERNFVLQPLADLAPDLYLPSGESVQVLLKAAPENALQKLED